MKPYLTLTEQQSVEVCIQWWGKLCIVAAADIPVCGWARILGHEYQALVTAAVARADPCVARQLPSVNLTEGKSACGPLPGASEHLRIQARLERLRIGLSAMLILLKMNHPRFKNHRKTECQHETLSQRHCGGNIFGR